MFLILSLVRRHADASVRPCLAVGSAQSWASPDCSFRAFQTHCSSGRWDTTTCSWSFTLLSPKPYLSSPTLASKGERSNANDSHLGVLCPPPVIWQCLKTILIVTQGWRATCTWWVEARTLPSSTLPTRGPTTKTYPA